MPELFDRDAFAKTVQEGVDRAGSYRKAARECGGVSPGALHKLSLGRMMPSAELYFRVYRWLKGDVPPLP